MNEPAQFKPQQLSHRSNEFAPGAAEWEDGVSRRAFLKMTAATLALSGLTACTKQPTQQILPYVNQPENLVPGEPLFYATAMTLGGFATGALVKSREGHPIKIEGNPEHPDTLGGSSVWLQASILDLYNPERSQAVMREGTPATWGDFLAELTTVARQEAPRAGAGLRILTETVTSPTLAAQIQQLLKQFPQAKWHQYEPINRDHALEGSRIAFGQPIEADYRFDQAAAIVSFESDFLYTHPARLKYSKQFARGRKAAEGGTAPNRLYVAESTPSITGSVADHRLPTESATIPQIAALIAREFGFEHENPPGTISPAAKDWISQVVAELKEHQGKSIVIAGETQPPAVHALAHLLNERLGNAAAKTVLYRVSAQAHAVNQLASLLELVHDLNAGAVETLILLGGNPVFNAPADLDFGVALKKVRHAIHLATEYNETSAQCGWHIPQSHYLESWSDARSFDGTSSIIQPLIAPLYQTKSAHELLAAFLQPGSSATDYDVVREFWKTQKPWPDFEAGWRKALHDGLIVGTENQPQQASLQDSVEGIQNALREHKPPQQGLELVFRPDPNLWDGQFANNGWLQECPKPLSKISWGNAVLISPDLARRNQIENNHVVEVRFANRKVRGPVWIMPGQAEHTVTLHLGHGRKLGATIAGEVGFDAYPLRTTEALSSLPGIALVKTGHQEAVVTTQKQHEIDNSERQVYRTATLEKGSGGISAKMVDPVEEPKRDETLYDPGEFKYAGYRWGMSIDLNTCIGCNSCLLACEVENNIPVVGRDQISRGRDLFWIRVDTYYEGRSENPRFNHMPVPCMHCEHAPCELVCPVEATVHDHEGLNLQVYNRCVGTRFCSNNCPYKVRRFNFFQYAQYHQPSLKPMYNPDVTVRWRGVMEKCTYCIQRISRARITAEKENRKIREGEVVTACQQACPADAIVFGDLNDPDSRVAKLKRSPLDYSMLGQLNTRPRTTYLARLENHLLNA